MKLPSFFADVHVHPTIKSFNWGVEKAEKNPWDSFDHIKPSTSSSRLMSVNSKDLAKYSQANFYKLINGNVRLIFNSLYPIERGFFNLRNVPKLLTSKKAQIEMVAMASGMGYDRTEYLLDHVDYYKELIEEYTYLKTHQGASPCGKYSYKVVNNYQELEASLKKKNELAVVVVVEGCHALFDEEMLSGKLDKASLKKKLTGNIESIKSWDHPPFMMNLMHHFYNGLGGHAKSLTLGAVLNQNKRIETDIEGLGIKALKELLSNRNGKRIHIDTKHMSLKARKGYYNWIRGYNYLNKYDTIPIFCSHSGVNGFKTMTGSKMKKDNAGKNSNSYFFNWAINLSDEELNIIHESGGLMGIMLDKGKVGGGGFHRRLSRMKSEKDKKNAYVKLIWDNLFHGIRAIGSKSAWDIFALGSDYDGAINHIEFYDDATKLPQLYIDMYEYLDKTKYEKKLWHGYKPEELLNKLFKENTMTFMEKHFV